MMLEFIVENFKSYKNRTVFSMGAGARLRRFKEENTLEVASTRLLKSAFLFGANASGKTNFLKAIALVQQMVVHPTKNSVTKLPWFPFGNSSDPTTFEVVFFKNENEYKYILQYDGIQIVKEELSTDKHCIFRREGQEVSIISTREGLQTLRKNQLLLYWAQDKNIHEAVEAFSWFASDIINLSDGIDAERTFNEADAKVLKNAQFKEKLLSVLRAADFNIYDYVLSENSSATKQIKGILGTIENLPEEVQALLQSDSFKVFQLILKHRMNGEDIYFPLQEESLGTQRFVQILVNILTEFEGGKIFLIDEFDRSFHVEMVKVLVKLMNQWNVSNQFIATTHQFNVMDFDIRSDQIYFANKSFEGLSEVYSVFDFADTALMRNDFDYKKRYLKGLYGGTQIVNYAQLEAIFADQES